MKVSRIALLASVAAMTATTAFASDFNFGSNARSIAMGGAGLALSDDASSSSIVNPASAAASGVKMRFVLPSLDFRSRGASLGDMRSQFNNVSGGSSDDALALATRFGTQPTTLAFSMVTGVTGAVGITAEGEAQGIITPGANFSDWVAAGLPKTAIELAGAIDRFHDSSFSTSITTALADGSLSNAEATGIVNQFFAGTNVEAKTVYALPSVNWGTGFTTSNSGNKLWVGTRMRWLHSETHSWGVAQKATTSNAIDLQAVELSKSKDSGFGADLGFIFQPKNSIVQWGAVVNNFVDARLTGIDTPRMLSIGMSSQPRASFRYAIDLVNVNKAYGESARLRMGAEWTISNALQFRAGNSGNGWTYGAHILGMDFAFAKDAPNMLSRSLRF